MSTTTLVQSQLPDPTTMATTMTTTMASKKMPSSAAAATATTMSGDVAAPTPAVQQLSSISLMLEYDIDNTLNTIKESGGHLIKDAAKFAPVVNKVPVNNHAPVISPAPTINHGAVVNHATNVNPAPLVNSSSVDEKSSHVPPTPPATPNLQTNARKRWRILAKVLRKDSEETVSSSGEEGEERTASVRRFKSFDLLRQDSFEDHMSLNCLGKPENWYTYRLQLDDAGQQEFAVNIHHVDRQLTASDLMGFNNTGNICVWPSEEALTAFVLADLAAYRGKWILELGGGFTCLTGLMLSKYARPYAVHLTDGNEVSVENVRKTVCLNELSCYTKCSVLKWEQAAARAPAEAAKFDTILSADCLFFDEARADLVDTIWYYLAPEGVALIMAPRRGKTMAHFVEQCGRRGFRVSLTQRYNETIWQRHLELQGSELYDEDLHYPVLIRLTKPPTATEQEVEAVAE